MYFAVFSSSIQTIIKWSRSWETANLITDALTLNNNNLNAKFSGNNLFNLISDGEIIFGTCSKFRQYRKIQATPLSDLFITSPAWDRLRH